MSPGQQYVSDELFHFVGRHEPTPQAQFKLLLKILRAGVLVSSKYDDPLAEIKTGNRLLAGELTRVPAICFCDIPERSLRNHTKKYSPFGLSFPKRFLSAKGAKPVFYIPVKSTTSEGHKTRGQDFPHRLRTMLKALRDLDNFRVEGEYDRVISNEEIRRLLSTAINQWRFLAREIYCFIKVFDEDLDPHHTKNYYTEREWRIAGNPVQTRLKFSLADLSHVMVPERFGTQLLKEIRSLGHKLINSPR